ncbi:methyl-accepting chemotaxis protein [Metabacillus sediminilitoris]|uniref:HAMP domain-containing protein n=1 Tax=Metabacillus sediminilitoris TaxID=2567941 RepID=A0A4S4C3N4_9BACI|nr:HAMP domain-containing methyl-accepting chemotaxis protein [Metabacillus sediminilitoris]QGQ45350.1 HAMP domain-containing protein [Metabacillus sediminilitoris]THF82352.1 HAMP domain-containing protein [Metabacillus sediminilitoris]
MKRSLRIKMLVTFSLIVLTNCIILAYISHTVSANLVKDTVSQLAGTIVQQAVDGIDVEKYEEITLDSGETDLYYQLREQLNELRETTGLTYLYTMSREQVNGTYQYYYMVDGMPVGSEDESLLGDVEEEIATFPAIVKTFETESMQVDMTFSQNWGGTVSAYVPIKNSTGDVIGIMGADLDATKVYQQLDENKLTLMMITVLILVISSVIIFFFTYYLLKPLKDLTRQVQHVGAGNLTAKMEIKRSDEIGNLSVAIDKMRENLRDMISNISNVAGSVSRHSEELTHSSNEVKQGSLQVAATMQLLSNGADTQADASRLLAQEMDNFSIKIQEANQNGEEISLKSNVVLELANEGIQYMSGSVHQMELINSIVHNSVQKVQVLDQQLQEITKLVDVINSIAGQTNLLALNAAIEAARAGEHGKGFAIVADEIRKLSVQVTTSVKDITEIVDNIQHESHDIVHSLEEGYDQVQNGSSQIQLTGEAFSKIHSSVSSMVERISVISKNLEVISTNSICMNDSIEKIAAISEESAAGVEETTSSVKQTHSSMEEISGNAIQLSQLAENLNDQVKNFQLK